MTKSFTLALLITLFTSVSFSQKCNIGNETKTASFTKDASFGSDKLMGIKRTLTQGATLTAINMIGNNTKGKFKMAVYKDKSGLPYNLVAQSEVSIVGDGLVTLPVKATYLEPGDYWIMSVYEVSTKHSDMNIAAPTSTYVGIDQIFKNALPEIVKSAGVGVYKGIDLLYFLTLKCGNTLSTDSFDLNNTISAYPNPTSDFLKIVGAETETAYVILNSIGSSVHTGVLSADGTIDVQSLKTGVYFVQLEGSKTIRFIKN